MKLKLNKQNITTLSLKDMSNVNGGGEKWSDFRTGNCNYSRQEGNQDTWLGCDNQDVVVGCLPKTVK